jgi:flavin reductase (DIM6/NTAB) family NADH-FMN oxidoreductase RutF
MPSTSTIYLPPEATVMTDVPPPVPGSSDELINGLLDISGTRTAVPGGPKPRRSVSADTLRAAFRLHPEGVTVVTAVDEFGDQIGMTATAVSSVSLEPPLVLACMANQSRMTSALTGGAGFVVHFLTGEQQDLALRFAQPLDDKFEHLSYGFTSAGCPRLTKVLAALECVGHEVFRGGDHLIVVGRVVDVRINHQATSGLVFFDGRFAPVALDAAPQR